MNFYLYNTLSRQKELFTPLSSERVDFYSCGPTVYNVVHIGNLRAFLCADILQRWLKYGMKYNVRWVMNITDVDDKTIRDSQKEFSDISPMEALKKFTRKYEELFFEDLEMLHIPKSSFFQTPRATESIEEMQDLIRKIVDRGYGYVQDGSIYFSIGRYKKDQTYGQLVSLDLSQLKTGTRTLADEIEKEQVQDFVLWKAQKEGEPYWDFQLQGQNYPGRPGWHIECSAMENDAFKKLPFDIHSGGVDLCFPHHEDEIAQSVAGYGVEPTKFWMHNEHLIIEGKKMSKSLGNFYTLHDLCAQGHDPDVIRFFLVTNHYRTKLNLSQESLQAAKSGLEKIQNFCRNLSNKNKDGGSVLELYAAFNEAICDDLNTPKAIAVIFQYMAKYNQQLEWEEQEETKILSAVTDSIQNLTEFFRYAEKIFGVPLFPQSRGIPPEVQELAEKRAMARRDAQWETADQLRQQIEKFGFSIRDDADGFTLLPL